MSMNIFFCALSDEEIDAAKEDPSTFEEIIESEEIVTLSTDVETAGEVLSAVLDGDGFQAGDFIEEALFNGCQVIYSKDVRKQAERLSKWTDDLVLYNLKYLNQQSGLYRQDQYKENPADLLEQFHKLVSFYRSAASSSLGVIYYYA